MNNQDFARIFYSNYRVGIDWENINEITWMYENKLFLLATNVVEPHNKFLKRLDQIDQIIKDYKLLKTGESDIHIVLKTIAIDYLINTLGINRSNIYDEYLLNGFKVDVIDSNLHFPFECGDTNPLKLEKYLTLPSTKKLFLVPYPHFSDIKVHIFTPTTSFYKYINHKTNYFRKLRTNYRK